MSTYVLVHGAWHGAWCWKYVTPLLENEGHKVVAPDLPGHGEDKTPIADITLEAYGFGIYAVCVRDVELGPAETFIGYCGFIPEQIEEAGPELAYAVGKSMWGKGLVTEALIACLDWIFTELKISRVHAVTNNENKASLRVMEKVGKA